MCLATSSFHKICRRSNVFANLHMEKRIRWFLIFWTISYGIYNATLIEFARKLAAVGNCAFALAIVPSLKPCRRGPSVASFSRRNFSTSTITFERCASISKRSNFYSRGKVEKFLSARTLKISVRIHRLYKLSLIVFFFFSLKILPYGINFTMLPWSLIFPLSLRFFF